MDRLEEIFTMQKALDDKIEREHNVSFSRDEWVQKDMLAIVSELSEVLMETNFKWWKNEKTVDEAKLKEELIDVLHFYVSLCMHCGMTADEMYGIYMSKNAENVKRQNGESDKKGYKAGE